MKLKVLMIFFTIVLVLCVIKTEETDKDITDLLSRGDLTDTSNIQIYDAVALKLTQAADNNEQDTSSSSSKASNSLRRRRLRRRKHK